MKSCLECEHRSEPDNREPCKSCLQNRARARMIVYNIRHRGAGVDNLIAEIAFRQDNSAVSDEKLFGYSTEELRMALTYWDML